ncbi:glycosyltransferase family 4 protein [Thalassoglobus polymorphus]|uniref:D-inositol 3-phosphate glycosyltransferase n=1 Tax=Thalassoglobus polymorphus TaxID=2527994 RepID=A0A517QGU3_9PLAN|nr:glycosyltransferase family 4 protein [Thalassoglobus polymorphus]QDT30777.1 D-inositol 3-phosphate glycosyltransferase [Thalassoglobus polymorphus]
MKRIGLLFEYTTLNGGEQSILAAIKELHRIKCDFVALAPSEGPLIEELASQNVPVENLQLRSETGERISQRDLIRQLRKVIKTHQLDLLHANSLTMGRILGGVTSELPVPTTTHIRDIMSLSRAAIRDLNQHARLMAVSHATRDYHIAQGLHPDRVETCYNGIDLKLFSPSSATGSLKQELGLPENARLAATIGQICLRKAQGDVADAAVILNERFPDLHFLLIGERHSLKRESQQFDEKITQTFEDAGMGKRLHRLGYRSDIRLILNEIDLVIHAARQEPLGRILLEAAACEVPVVATKVGGTSEILTHEESALLVESENPTAIAEQVERLLDSSTLQQRLAKQARQEVIERFDISSNADKLLQSWANIS